MDHGRLFQQLLATAAMLFLLPPRADAAKHKERPGWACRGAEKNAAYYWEQNDQGQVTGANLRWSAVRGNFQLLAHVESATALPSGMPPALMVTWNNPRQTARRLPDRRIELTDGAGPPDKPFAVSHWMPTRPRYELVMLVDLPGLADAVATMRDPALLVRQRDGEIVEREPLPPGVMRGAEQEIRAALLEMARASANVQNSTQCVRQDDLDLQIVIG